MVDSESHLVSIDNKLLELSHLFLACEISMFTEANPVEVNRYYFATKDRVEVTDTVVNVVFALVRSLYKSGLSIKEIKSTIGSLWPIRAPFGGQYKSKYPMKSGRDKNKFKRR